MSELEEKIKAIIAREMASNPEAAAQNAASQIMQELWKEGHPVYHADAIDQLDSAIEAAFEKTADLRQLFAFKFGVKT